MQMHLNRYKFNNSLIYNNYLVDNLLIIWIIVMSMISYQAVDNIQRYRSNHLSTPKFITTYRPSPLLRSKNNSPTVHIRILEEPLTARNFSLIISALTELHTKCWLI